MYAVSITAHNPDGTVTVSQWRPVIQGDVWAVRDILREPTHEMTGFADTPVNGA